MAKIKLEYIWLDGYTPEPNMRSKTKVIDGPENPTLADLPDWSFDGSSTEQAAGHSSDCLLKPVAIIPDTARSANHPTFLVLCEVLTADGQVHPSNYRGTFDDDDDLWVAFEQEYVIMQDGRPVGFPPGGYPGPQGPFYCSVGHDVAKGREVMEDHLDLCLDSGIGITGTNAEVLMGQWEFQCFAKGAKKAADDLWFARYLLVRTAEEHGYTISFEPKPIKGDWNGSGMHCNFSNTAIREQGGEEYIRKVCEAFRPTHDEHIAVYGSKNDERLTGKHETQSIDQFSYGVSDRGASIRIPVATVQNGWKGYLEDRRPAANADPYKIIGRLIATLKTVD